MVSVIFFFQNSWKREFQKNPQSWKHVNWYTFHSMSAKLCLYRNRKSSNDNLHFSTPLRKPYSRHLRGRRIIIPISYWSYFYISLYFYTLYFLNTSIFLFLKKSKYTLYFHTHVIFKKHIALSSDTTLTSTATPRFLEEMLPFMSPSKQRWMQF